MTPEEELAQHLRRTVTLDPIAFQSEIKSLSSSPHLLPLLSQLLASELPHQQKQLAATGINFIVGRLLQENPKRWPLIWEEFQKHLLLGAQVDKMEWKLYSLLSKSVQALMDEFQGQFCRIINAIFDRLSFRAKLLVYESFVYVQTTEQTRYVFLRETVELFLNEVFVFLCWAHERGPSADSSALEEASLQTLKLLLSHLESMEGDKFNNTILASLRLNEDLFSIVLEELLFDPSKSSYTPLPNREFGKQRMGELVLIGSSPEANGNKANAMQVLKVVLSCFDKKSTIEEFDAVQQLNFMQNLVPLVGELLIRVMSQPQIKEEEEVTVVALLDWLGFTSKFNFMLEYFEGKFQNILFGVCYPILALDEDELQQFKQNGQGFIQITEEMVEQPPDRAQSPKNSASDLLQNMVHAVNGALTNIVDLNVRIARHLLTGEPESSCNELKSSFGLEVSIQTCFTVLSLVAEQYESRPDLIDTIKTGLLDLPEINGLEGIAQAKLMLFLTYTYQTIYKGREPEATRFLLRAARHLDEQSTLSDCSLLLFQNCIQLDFQTDIWELLLSKIVNGQSIQLLQVMKDIVEKRMHLLAPPAIRDLIQRVTDRLIKEFGRCREEGKGVMRGSRAFLKCLNILQQIAQHSEYIASEPQLIDALWPVFDLFQFVQQIEFEDNILSIFANVVRASPKISDRHFAVISAMPQIHRKTGLFTKDMLTVFTELILRGREHFFFGGHLADLEKTLACLKECYNVVKKEETLKYICLLYQYAYSQFGDVLPKDLRFVEKVEQLYEQLKDSLQEETLAAMINLFLTLEVEFGYPFHQVIRNHSITIFRGYQAQIVSVNLRKLIEKHFEDSSVINYLQYAIRLLHFIRAQAEHPPKEKYSTLQFKGVEELDPFEETCKALNFLKEGLDPGRYDSLIEALREEISLGEVRDLLAQRIVSRSLRTYLRVKETKAD